MSSKISSMLFHKRNGEWKLGFAVTEKTINGVDYYGIVTEVGGAVHWSPKSEVKDPD